MIPKEHLAKIDLKRVYNRNEIAREGLIWGRSGKPVTDTTWVVDLLKRYGFKPIFDGTRLEYRITGEELLAINKNLNS